MMELANRLVASSIQQSIIMEKSKMCQSQKFKIYQLQKERVDTKYNLKLNVIAEYTTTHSIIEILQSLEKANYPLLEKIWHYCNITCWDAEYKMGSDFGCDYLNITPNENFQGYVNSDIIVETPNGIYKAEIVGFSKVESVEDGIYKELTTGVSGFNWEKILNKNDFSEEMYNKYKEIAEKQ